MDDLLIKRVGVLSIILLLVVIALTLFVPLDISTEFVNAEITPEVVLEEELAKEPPKQFALYLQMRSAERIVIASNSLLLTGNYEDDWAVIVASFLDAMLNFPKEARYPEISCWNYNEKAVVYSADDAQSFELLALILCTDRDFYRMSYTFPIEYLIRNQIY